MLNIKKLFKALRILNSSDQSKAVELSISDSATTNTKTTVVAQQTANRSIVLPDISATLIGNVNNNANISGVSVNLNNTTENKLLVAGTSTGNSLIQDSSITHVEAVSTVTLSVSKDLLISAPNKEVTIDGKALRIPVVAFIPTSPPSGNQGDVLFNPTSQSIWMCDNTGFFVEQISASGANRTLSNLLSPTSINQDLIPNGTRSLGNVSNKFNASLNTVTANSLSVATTATITGNLTADKVICNELDIIGATTIINATTVDSLDPNITLNKSGNDTTSQGAGLTIDRTGTKGSLVYDSGLTSRFKVGDLSSESEVMSVGTNQLVTGNKFFNGITSFGQALASESGVNATLSASRNLLVLSNASLVSIGKISYTAGINNVKGTIVNTLTTAVTLKHQISSGTTDGELYIPGAVDYVLAPGASVTFNAVTSGLIRIYYFECKVDTSKIGMIESFAGEINQIPNGYLLCDGSIVSQTTYPLLYSKIINNWKKYNQTIASNTFVLPDLRGAILKGASSPYNLTAFNIGAPSILGVQSGTGWSQVKIGDRVFVSGAGVSGFYYIDSITNAGSFTIHPTLSDCFAQTNYVSFTSNGAISVVAAFDKDFSSRYGSITAPSLAVNSSITHVGSNQNDQYLSHTHTLVNSARYNTGVDNVLDATSISASGADGQIENRTTSASGGNETRPENKSVNYIIKAIPDYN